MNWWTASSSGAPKRGRFSAVAMACVLIAACTAASPRFQTEAAVIGDVRDVVPAVGQVHALQEVNVRAPQPGQIENISVRPNERVRRGQMLARIAPGNVTTDLQEARANSAGAEAALRENEARLRESLRLRNARTQLVERGLYSAGALAAIQGAVEADTAATDQARAAVRAAAARLQKAERAVSDLVIRSPIDGIVLARNGEPGEMVGPNDEEPMFIVVDGSPAVIVRAEVPESDIARVTADVSVQFTAEAYPRATFTGQIRNVLRAPQGDGAFVAYIVEIEAGNPDGRLVPGMSASVEFIHSDARQVLRAPIQSLYFTPDDYTFEPPSEYRSLIGARNLTSRENLNAVETGMLIATGKRRVFVEKNGKWERREITLGAEGRDYIEIIDGASVGDLFIVSSTVGARR